MLQQTVLALIISLAFALPAAALTAEDYYKAPPTEFLEAIAESPRGKDDPIAQAKRVPIIFKQAGHILVTDTDCEPYTRTFTKGANRKFSEDIYYSNKLCKQAAGLSELELTNWLGEPQQTLLAVNSTGTLIYIRRYLFGGGEIPVFIASVNGQCTEAWCDYKWNRDKLPNGGEWSFFTGRTDSELFKQFGQNLLFCEKPVQSLSDLPQSEKAKFKLSLYDNELMMADHKCYEVLKIGHRVIGYVFEVYMRPTH